MTAALLKPGKDVAGQMKVEWPMITFPPVNLWSLNSTYRMSCYYMPIKYDDDLCFLLKKKGTNK